MVKLPPRAAGSNERPYKSTSDLTQPSQQPSQQPSISKLHPNLQKSTPEISPNPQGSNNNNAAAVDVNKLSKKDLQKLEKEQKLLEKTRLDEQKKRDKLAAQEKAKHDKLKKEKQKYQAQKRAKEAKKLEKENKAKNDKDKGKSKTAKPAANPLAQGAMANPRAQGPSEQGPSTQAPQNSTNTLESSISRTSGPPPYNAVPTQAKREVVKNKNDNTGNTSFGKPDDGASSWDMISQHRQQMGRPVSASTGRPKQTVIDLQFNVSGNKEDNTEA